MIKSINLANFIEEAKKASPHEDLIVSNDQVIRKKGFFGYFNCTSQQKKESLRTWKIFRQAMEMAWGQERVKEIENRYLFSISDLQNGNLPLRRRQIEMFCVGASLLRTSHLKRISLGKLKYLSAPEISKKIQILNPVPFLGDFIPGYQLEGGPTEKWGYFYYNRFAMDQKRMRLLQDAHLLSQEAYRERFAKAIVSHDMEEKTIIPAPSSEGELDYYKVYRKISGGGLVAYALKPLSKNSHLKPVIAFRPSQLSIGAEGAFETWLNDMEPNIGEMGYVECKEEFAKLMKDSKFCPKGTKIQAWGYSLGGAQLEHFLKDHWRKLSEVFFYNNQSVQSLCAEEFAARINRLPRFEEEPLRMTIYRTYTITASGERKGDLVHYFGEKHMGWGITHPDVEIKVVELIRKNTNPLFPLPLHSLRFFDKKPDLEFIERVIQDEKLFDELDNSRRGDAVSWYEKMRYLICVKFLYPLFHILYHGLKYFFDCLGIKVFISSKKTP